MAKKIVLGSLLALVILTASFVYYFGDEVKIDVQKTRTQYYVNESNKWVLAANEYVYVYNGTKKIPVESRELVSWVDSDYAYTKRISTLKDNITLIQKYTFSKENTEVDKFPLNNEVECINCLNKILQFEYKNILYGGETKDITSIFNFGHRMSLYWQEGSYYAKVTNSKSSSDKVVIKYKIANNYEKFKVLLVDPVYNSNFTYLSPTSISNGSEVTVDTIKVYNQTWLKFDGTNDNINVSNNFSQTLNNSFTISFWLYPNNTNPFQFIWDVQDDYDGISKGVGVNYYAGDNYSRLYLADGSVEKLTYTGSINQSKWSMITFTVNRLGNVTPYIDGMQNGDQVNITAMNKSIDISVENLTIGAHRLVDGGDNFYDSFFSGQLDDLRVYNTSLSSAEVLNIYSEGRK
jgi:hypothetical protein